MSLFCTFYAPVIGTFLAEVLIQMEMVFIGKENIVEAPKAALFCQKCGINRGHLASNIALIEFYWNVILDLSSISDAKMTLTQQAHLTTCKLIFRNHFLRK